MSIDVLTESGHRLTVSAADTGLHLCVPVAGGVERVQLSVGDVLELLSAIEREAKRVRGMRR